MHHNMSSSVKNSQAPTLSQLCQHNQFVCGPVTTFQRKFNNHKSSITGNTHGFRHMAANTCMHIFLVSIVDKTDIIGRTRRKAL